MSVCLIRNASSDYFICFGVDEKKLFDKTPLYNKARSFFQVTVTGITKCLLLTDFWMGLQSLANDSRWMRMSFGATKAEIWRNSIKCLHHFIMLGILYFFLVEKWNYIFVVQWHVSETIARMKQSFIRQFLRWIIIKAFLKDVTRSFNLECTCPRIE